MRKELAVCSVPILLAAGSAAGAGFSAGGRPLAICGIDAIGLFFEDVQRIREGARAKLKRDIDVIVVSTHVHEGPDTIGLWGPQMGVSGIDDAYNQLVVGRTIEAVEEAVSGMRPATVRAAGVTPADVGRFFDDDRPPHLNDPEILVLSLDDMSRRRIATLVNRASHPEALGGMQSPLGAKIDDPRTGQPAPANAFRFAEIAGEYVARHVLDVAAIGYSIPKAQWDEKAPCTFGAQKRWYGEVNSVGPEAAPIIADAFPRLITAGARRD